MLLQIPDGPNLPPVELDDSAVGGELGQNLCHSPSLFLPKAFSAFSQGRVRGLCSIALTVRSYSSFHTSRLALAGHVGGVDMIQPSPLNIGKKDY